MNIKDQFAFEEHLYCKNVDRPRDQGLWCVLSKEFSSILINHVFFHRLAHLSIIIFSCLSVT